MRALFAVALAVALLAVALPAVDTAGRDRAASQTRDAVATLVDAARTLAGDNDAVADADAAARTSLTLSLPGSGFASAPLASLTVGPPADGHTPTAGAVEVGEDGDPTADATRVTWRVAGGQRHATAVGGLRMRASGGGRFRLERGGPQRVVLRLVAREGERVVTVGVGGPG